MSSLTSSMPVGGPYGTSIYYPESWIVEKRPLRKTRASCAKFIERQVIEAWKRITRVTRKHQRASLLPKDFVLVTSRRRSVRFR